jgi:hypothetical protein
MTAIRRLRRIAADESRLEEAIGLIESHLDVQCCPRFVRCSLAGKCPFTAVFGRLPARVVANLILSSTPGDCRRMVFGNFASRRPNRLCLDAQSGIEQAGLITR